MQVTADHVVSARQDPSFPVIQNGNIWWQERDPKRGHTIKTNVLKGAVPQIWLQMGSTIGSRVHNYGGSAFAVGYWPEGNRPNPSAIGSAHANTLLCAFVRSDQALCEAGYGVAPRCLWQREGCHIGGLSVVVSPQQPSFQCIVGVLEDVEAHRDDIAVWSLEGRLMQRLRVGEFCSAPVVSPSGKTLAVVAWNNPHAPWQRTRLIIAQRDSNHPEFRIVNQLDDPRWGAIVHPVLMDDHTVLFSSDCAEHWDVYRWHFGDTQFGDNSATATLTRKEQTMRVDTPQTEDAEAFQRAPPAMVSVERVATSGGDFVLPPWQLGNRTFGCLPDGRIVAAVQRLGRSFLWLGGKNPGEVTITGYDITCVSHLCVSDNDVVILASGADFLPTLISFTIPLNNDHSDHPRDHTRRVSDDKTVDAKEPHSFSAGKHFLPKATIDHPLQSRIACWSGLGKSFSVKIPVDNDHTHAHLWLSHKNPETPSASAAIITVHGGPTAQSWPDLNMRSLYWLTRGYHWVDVNFRGSTGFGRRYRMALEHQWGVYDVADVMAVYRYLVRRQLIRPERYVLYGASAGGLTALLTAAQTQCNQTETLPHHQVSSSSPQMISAPAAVVLRYPVVDLLDLAHTHRFEQHYTQWLLGGHPPSGDGDTPWHRRSPINHLERLISVPLLIFHGANDPVVSASQVENFCKQLTALGGNVELEIFADEGHGFAKRETHAACMAKEEQFLARHVPTAGSLSCAPRDEVDHHDVA